MSKLKYKNNLLIFALVLLSILTATFLWSKINLPYSNTHKVEGVYASLKYSSYNDVASYIFFIGFLILSFVSTYVARIYKNALMRANTYLIKKNLKYKKLIRNNTLYNFKINF